MAGNVTTKTSEPIFAEFDPDNFSQSTNINNQWHPVKPGSRWVYQGKTTESGKTLPRRIEITVTDLVKEIAGVKTLVVWAMDKSDNKVVEKEIAFYAQDDSGNVWYFGEYPEEYENGKFIAAPFWIAGYEGAKSGIKMWADPTVILGSYFQGWGPQVEWSDFAKVDGVGQKMCVPVACFEDVLVMAESSLEEKNAFQLKSYAKGTGNIAVRWRGKDALQEELDLIEFVQLTESNLTKFRQEALDLEKSAFEKSPDVYGQTKPAQTFFPG